MVIAIIKSTPEIDSDVINNLKQSSKIYDKDGNYIEQLVDPIVGDRQVISIKDMPKYLPNAFIAIEDERFRQHNGIDVKRILGAFVHDIATMSKAQGGSTITQQLIRNYALTKKKNWSRKIQEAYMAIQLEKKLSKDQILEDYLNIICLGGNKYGVESASLYYFGKHAKDLNVAESALLAGMTQAPEHYSPYNNTKTPNVYINRQRTVLKKMYQLGFITQKEYTDACNYKLVFTTNTSSTTKYQWFLESAINQVASDYASTYNVSKQDAYSKLRTGGYKITLTLDQYLQKTAEDTVNDSSYYPIFKDKSWSTFTRNSKDKPLVEPQVAAVLMDNSTGEVRAIVGGRGDHPLQSLNRATQVARQPGSSIKPLSVYSPSLENKLITPATILDDSPMPSDFVNANKWNPQNDDGKFRGNVTVRQAVADSINIPAIKVLQTLGVDTSIKYLTNNFHLSTIQTKQVNGHDDRNLPSLALGGLTNGVTPLEMAAAYSAFANGGIYSEPCFYTKVVDSKGNTILERKPKQSRALSPQAAYVMTDILKSVIKEGTAIKANLGSMPAGGKTGTSDNHKNGWFDGFTPYYTCIVWMGHDDLTKYITSYATKDDATGKTLPASANISLVGGTCVPIWKNIMLAANNGLANKDFTKPSGVVQAQVCAVSGKAPSDYCGSNVRTELFIEGTEPTQICDVHKPAAPVQTQPAPATP